MRMSLGQEKPARVRIMYLDVSQIGKLCLFLFFMVLTGWEEGKVYYVELREDGKLGTGSPTDPFGDLQFALDQVPDKAVLLIRKGVFAADPVEESEEFCGNCLEPKTRVSYFRGFAIRGKSVTLRGKGVGETILQTNAGYGILVENAPDVTISYLKITGGRRDADGNATDAAVVVRNSRVSLDDVLIEANNEEREGVVVGIGGVFGREGAVISIRNSVIRDNSWDGVALYRGSTAIITDTLIQKGRGAGVGVTWDASALLVRVTVKDYWKGIGAFSDALVVVKNSLVAHQLGWGIIAFGNARIEVWNSVIAKNGNCGVAFWSENTSGVLVNNIIWGNGGREYWVCPRVGLWNVAKPENLRIRFNLFSGNKEKEVEGLGEVIGKNGNISADPLFSDEEFFQLSPDSPAVDAGDAGILDPDGTRSDLGIYGGPFAIKEKEGESNENK